jgi:hypothetical protein
MSMFAVFRNQQFSNFAPGTGGPASKPADPEHMVELPQPQLLRLRAIYRSGFEAQALLTEAGLVVTPTQQRRAVVARVLVRQEEGGGIGTVTDLHKLSEEAAGEAVADELKRVTGGKVELTGEQGQVRAVEAVRELLEKHPAPSRPHLLEAFQGLWTVAHVDMREALAEGLRNALSAIKERGVTKMVEKAVLSATQQRTAALA